MTEAKSVDRVAFYSDLVKDVKSLLAPQRDVIANTSNVAALIFNSLKSRVNWAGFYFVRPVAKPSTQSHVLILGPFGGKPAVVRIPFGRGVCGTACVEQKTQLVPDVHAHPNHIACDSASQSEIVVPIFDKTGALVAVLDIDAPVPNGFDTTDQEGLEQVAQLLGQGCDWANLEWPVEARVSDDEAPVCSSRQKRH